MTFEGAARGGRSLLCCTVQYLVAVDDSPLPRALVAAQDVAQPAVVLSAEHGEVDGAQVASVGGLAPVPLLLGALLPGRHRIDLIFGGGGEIDRDEAVHSTAASCT